MADRANGSHFARQTVQPSGETGQTGSRRAQPKAESNSEREAKVPAPVLDSTSEPLVSESHFEHRFVVDFSDYVGKV